MVSLSDEEIVEKWVHIVEKVFPAQTHITSALQTGGPLIGVRWKDEENPNALDKRVRGVDLFFPTRVLENYQQSDAASQLKWDAFLESVMTEKLRNFDPHSGDATQPERWILSAELPSE